MARNGSTVRSKGVDEAKLGKRHACRLGRGWLEMDGVVMSAFVSVPKGILLKWGSILLVSRLVSVQRSKQPLN